MLNNADAGSEFPERKSSKGTKETGNFNNVLPMLTFRDAQDASNMKQRVLNLPWFSKEK
jgi:hypothetical protein